MKWEKGEFEITDDKRLLDIKRVHLNLSQSYWATNIPYHLVEKSIQHSLCFGVYKNKDLIGFGRVITDQSTFAYLADVYIEEAHRGAGLGKWFMECVTSHPDLQGLRRFCLGTRDAHGLYKQFGFEVIKDPENFMEIKIKNIYL